MGKKKSANGLGRSIIRDRFGSKGRRLPDSHLHTSEIDDGYDWNKLNLRSVTEENSLDEFLATAQMAGTEFTAEKMNIKFVSQASGGLVLSPEEAKKIKQAQDDHRQLLSIPRRPGWDEKTTASELDLEERNSFLEWRRKLAQLQDVEGLILTPFERNLDFWRQLWRVIERSDVIVQIVDARNPLLFRADDLEKYVLEVNQSKMNMILMNKADYLTQEQREMWASYFDAAGVLVAFWSAIGETERLKEEAKAAAELENENGEHVDEEESDEGISSSQSSDEEISSADSIDDDKDGDDNEKRYMADGDAALGTGDVEKSEQAEHRDIIDGNVSVKQVSDCDAGTREVDATSSVESVCDKEQSMCKDCETQRCEVHGSVIGTSSEVHGSVIGTSSEVHGSVIGTSSAASLPTENNSTENKTPSTLPDTDTHCESMESQTGHIDSVNHPSPSVSTDNTSSCGSVQLMKNNPAVLDGPQLIDLFKCLHKGKKFTEGVTTIGMVGYPNVGKSSSINALLQTKKVPVSATPGRTKHFQTLFLDETLMLCDCPGLVMPTFVNTKADMVISGILPIDQMRDYVLPVAAVCSLIPRQTFENLYGIMIPKPREGEDENRPPTPHELLAAYAYMRGYMTHKGIPDFQRASRHILKDFVMGRLLYSHPPPDSDVERFCPTPVISIATKERSHPQPKPVGSKLKNKPVKYRNQVDQDFFEKNEAGAGTKGIPRVTTGQSSDLTSSQTSLTEKPWKRHGNRGKKEKLRRLHSHLDA